MSDAAWVRCLSSGAIDETGKPEIKKNKQMVMKQNRTAFTDASIPAPASEDATRAAMRAIRVAARPDPVPASPLRHARLARVRHAVQLTPNMRRVTLEGAELAGFPAGHEGAHVKLMLPAPRQSEHDFRGQLIDGARRPITRTYTVRHHRPEANEIDIDFALHADGRACAWARSARPGDFVAIAGPGAKKVTDFSAPWFLFVADMTAIPAAAAILEEMPRGAVGHAVFEITCEDDRQTIDAPAGIAIHWHVNAEPERLPSRQLDMVRALPWREGSPGVFVAGESSVMKALRAFVTIEKGIDRKAIYASAYWKIGMREDQLRALKDAEAQAAAAEAR